MHAPMFSHVRGGEYIIVTDIVSGTLINCGEGVQLYKLLPSYPLSFFLLIENLDGPL